MVPTVEEFESRGWFLSLKGIELIASEHEPKTLEEYINYAKDMDLCLITSKGIKKNNEKLTELPSPVVLQVVQVRNIAAPSINQNETPRLLQITLTDGTKNKWKSVEMYGPVECIKLHTPPGTKVLVTKPIVLRDQIALLGPGMLKDIGGHVQDLVQAWRAGKQFLKRNRIVNEGNKENGPPAFVPFKIKSNEDKTPSRKNPQKELKDSTDEQQKKKEKKKKNRQPDQSKDKVKQPEDNAKNEPKEVSKPKRKKKSTEPKGIEKATEQKGIEKATEPQSIENAAEQPKERLDQSEKKERPPRKLRAKNGDKKNVAPVEQTSNKEDEKKERVSRKTRGSTKKPELKNESIIREESTENTVVEDVSNNQEETKPIQKEKQKKKNKKHAPEATEEETKDTEEPKKSTKRRSKKEKDAGESSGKDPVENNPETRSRRKQKEKKKENEGKVRDEYKNSEPFVPRVMESQSEQTKNNEKPRKQRVSYSQTSRKEKNDTVEPERRRKEERRDSKRTTRSESAKRNSKELEGGQLNNNDVSLPSNQQYNQHPTYNYSTQHGYATSQPTTSTQNGYYYQPQPYSMADYSMMIPVYPNAGMSYGYSPADHQQQYMQPVYYQQPYYGNNGYQPYYNHQSYYNADAHNSSPQK